MARIGEKIDVIICVCAWLISLVAGSVLRDYCIADHFNASCPRDHVVMMEQASYGFPSVSRCLPRDQMGGRLGCKEDVMGILDGRCSGRSQCTVDVITVTRLKSNPCGSGIEHFMVAGYSCVPVASGKYRQCQFGSRKVLTGGSGYIATHQHCHQWTVRVARGQRVNVTLIYYNYNSFDRSLDNTCIRLAEIRENGAPRDICGTSEKHEIAYVSETNEINIDVFNASNTHGPIHFLLKYEAFGCGLPVVPRGAYFKRDGDQATIICNHTSGFFYIRCVNGRWNGGEGMNCSLADTQKRDVDTEYDWTSPLGLIIVVGLGVVIGVILGVLLLAIVMMWMRRHRSERSSRPDDTYDDVLDQPEGARESLPYYTSGGDPYKMGQYTDIWREQMAVTNQATLAGHDKVMVPAAGSQHNMSPDSSMPMLPGEKTCIAPGTLPRGKHCFDSPKIKRVEYYSKAEMT